MKCSRILTAMLWISMSWAGPTLAQQHAAHDESHAIAEHHAVHGQHHATPPDPAHEHGHDDGAHAGHHSAAETPVPDHHAMHSMHHDDETAVMGRASNPASTTDEPRSPDYSDGVAHSVMTMPVERFGMFTVEQLEQWHGIDRRNGQRWKLSGWYGDDRDRALLRSEGQREARHHRDGNIEALWSHAAAPFWNTELGVRHDFGDNGGRDWLAFGVAGLAPYFIDLRATAYLASGGHTALRLEAGHELRLTRHLLLTPELQLEFRGKPDPAHGTARGLAERAFGLRLRYEIRPDLAPYLGVQYIHRRGAIEATRNPGRQWVAGLRFWF